VSAPALRAAVRRWYPLGLVFLAIGLSTAMWSPFLTLFLTNEVHANSWQVTLFLVTSPLAGVGVSTLLGRVSDRRPIRRYILIAAALAGVGGAGVTAFVRDYWVLLATAVVMMAVAGAVMPQAFAYARVVLQGSPAAAMTTSALRTLFSIAWVGGPPLAALLLDIGGFTASYGFAALMYAVAALVAYAWLPEPKPDLGPHSGEPLGGITTVHHAEAPRRVIAMSVLAFVLMQCSTGLGVQSMSLLITGPLHGPLSNAGLVLGLCAGLEIPLMLSFGALSTRVPLRRLLLAGPLVGIAYLLVVGTAQHIWVLAAAQVLNACTISLVQGLGVTYIQDLMPRHPGRASTLFGNSFAAGSMLAGPILGASQHFGYRTSYAIAACIAACGFALLVMARPPAVRAVADPISEPALAPELSRSA
jgi:MFS transporter, SET family, sugar efflux transporter